ncbi:hypothetical protein BHM03_00008295 [Ensete ventricosum]|nr:hypothetical protein BHM03_00008295 [Ensete ventricosum]
MEDSIDREQDAAIQLGKPSDKFDPLPTPEVDKVANALKSSCTDLHQVVVDPLRDAIMQADKIVKSRLVEMTNDMEQQEIQHQVGARRTVSAVEKGAKENSADETMEQSRKNDSPDVDGTTEQSRKNALHLNRESSVEKQLDEITNRVQTDAEVHAGINRTGTCNTRVVPKRSLMDWNPTAHTCERYVPVRQLTDMRIGRRGREKKRRGRKILEVLFACAIRRSRVISSPVGGFFSPRREKKSHPTWGEGMRRPVYLVCTARYWVPYHIELSSVCRNGPWGEDSIESSSLVPSEKVCLRSPKRRKKLMSYLYGFSFSCGRHGKGNWKIILNCYSDIFEERTEVSIVSIRPFWFPFLIVY